jgi:hypothetical protein
LLLDGTVIAWRTLSFGGPHHYNALSLLKIERVKVAAFLIIGSDRATTALASRQISAEELVERLARADAHLHVQKVDSQDDWSLPYDPTQDAAFSAPGPAETRCARTVAAGPVTSHSRS